MTSVNLRWALHYASLGIPLLRLRPGDKRLVDLGQHRSLEERATTDARTIACWYEEEPYTNIAQPMGRLSGTITFDIDSYEADEAFHRWRDEVSLPLTDEVVHSPRNFDSRHYRYALPAYNSRNPEHALPEGHPDTLPAIPSPPAFRGIKGFDIRADGSYCVLPPSSILVTVPGAEPVPSSYRWDATMLPHDGVRCTPRVGLTPEAVTDLQSYQPTLRPGVELTSDAALNVLPSTAEFERRGFGFFTGSRNRDCYRLAWRLWQRYGLTSEAVVYGILGDVWRKTPQPIGEPFSWHEATVTAVSARRSLERRQQQEATDMTQYSGFTASFEADR